MDRANNEDHQIAEMPFWIRTKKDEPVPRNIASFENVNVDNFSDMQRRTYNIVKTHSQQTQSSDPLLPIVIGEAGTGKSYLINAVQNLLQTSCAITVTTGKASYNISGSTIHSLLKLPFKNHLADYP